MSGTQFLSIGETARRSGLTVRALRYYEEQGLLAAVRGSNGQRYFADAQLRRLQQVLVLKSVGLTLSQIRAMLSRDDMDMEQVVAVQLAALRHRCGELKAAIGSLEAVLKRIRAGGAPDIDTLCDLIQSARSMDMDNPYKDVIKAYFTDEQLARLEARKPDQEVLEKGQAAWAELLSKVEALAEAGADPAGAEAQAAAQEWQALVDSFTQGDADIEANLGRMYQERHDWPGAVKPPVNDTAWAFMAKAKAAREAASGA
ncbi:MAG: MerR family transcriptional regulator [Methyloligellaceae bacterium]